MVGGKHGRTMSNWEKIEASHLLICFCRKLPLVLNPWRHRIFIFFSFSLAILFFGSQPKQATNIYVVCGSYHCYATSVCIYQPSYLSQLKSPTTRCCSHWFLSLVGWCSTCTLPSTLNSTLLLLMWLLYYPFKFSFLDKQILSLRAQGQILHTLPWTLPSYRM